jgi:glycosyltransferase involved in cell wall biosynthesis
MGLQFSELKMSSSEVIKGIATAALSHTSSSDLARIAQVITQNRQSGKTRQLLIDVSELVARDSRSGIQRVVRSVLLELLSKTIPGFRVEPIYAIKNALGFRYARKFTCQFLGLPSQNLVDEPIEKSHGDVFLGLDLQHNLIIEQAGQLRLFRQLGIKVYFLIYDLIPILVPWSYPDGNSVSNLHSAWLNILHHQDGVVCISKSVADEFKTWLASFGTKRLRPLKIGWFHLGADVSRSVPTRGLHENTDAIKAELKKRPTFLSVGTLEPRKAQTQILKAFELLWQQGQDINLVLVGKKGWSGRDWDIEAFCQSLTTHPKSQSRLFWLDSISDEYLEIIYEHSNCLIAASHAEGFGLPLIEAAMHNLPIIARDIPVFREVAGDHAFYFQGSTADCLASCVDNWLKLNNSGNAPSSKGIEWLTWKESTQGLINVIIHNEWESEWCGLKNHTSIVAHGEAVYSNSLE